MRTSAPFGSADGVSGESESREASVCCAWRVAPLSASSVGDADADSVNDCVRLFLPGHPLQELGRPSLPMRVRGAYNGGEAALGVAAAV